MTNVVVKKSYLSGDVTPPSSKSVAHRLILASAISRNQTKIYGNLNSNDIIATLKCIESLGAKVVRIEGGVEIIPSTLVSENVTFNVKESGSTMRFLLPLLPIYGKSFTMVGEGRIGERPITALKETMAKVGVEVESNFLPTKVEGSYNGNIFEIDPSLSSQYLTGLLFTLYALGGGTIITTGKVTSKGYVDVTLDVLKKFGVEVENNKDKYIVNVNNPSNAPREINVDGDWSSACFWIVGALLNGSITLNGLSYPSAQPDSVIIEIARKMGGKVKIENNEIKVEKSSLKAIDFNADDSPDIVPILSVACAFADGVSTITGIERLRVKESDRVKTVTDMLLAVGIKVENGYDYIKIYGNSKIKGGTIDSANDHRIAMSGIILSIMGEEETIVRGVECVSKSYPNFLKDFISLGGECNEL